MMKSYRMLKSILPFLLSCLLLCACNTDLAKNRSEKDADLPNVAFDAGEDYDRSDSHIASRFTDTEDVAYFVTGGATDTTGGYAYLRYIDKKTGISGVLCGRPECMHNDASCNAFLGIGPACWGISVYGKHLYYVGEKSAIDKGFEGLYLYEANLDGSGRKEVVRLESAESMKYLNDNTVQIHRGYCFIGGTLTDINDGQQCTRISITAYSLDGKEKYDVYSSEEYSEAVIGMKMQPVGDEFYFFDAWMDAETRIPGRLRVMKWNIKNKTSEELYQGEVPFFPDEFWVADDEEILFSCAIPVMGEIYAFDPVQKSFHEKFAFGDIGTEERSVRIADGKMVSYSYVTKYAERRIEIRDFDGNRLYHKVDEEPLLDEKELPYIRCFLGADHEKLYFMFTDISMLNEKPNPETLVKSISFDGKEEILWSTENRK